MILPHMCFALTLGKLDENSELAIIWFKSNYMKLKTDKFHLIVSKTRYGNVQVNIDKDIIWKNNNGNLLGVNISNKLKFDKHISNICLRTNRKLNFLTRFSNFRSLAKRLALFRSIIESQFKYGLLLFMFHEQQKKTRKCMKHVQNTRS